MKRILQIGNWPPPFCGWSMHMVELRRELEAQGWDCQVMNLNENRRTPSPDYLDVQNGWDFLVKVARCVRRGYAVHVRVNGESKKGYLLALAALLVARFGRRPALLTYAGGHQQSYFPAPTGSLRALAFGLLLRLPTRIYCNSEAVKRALLTTGIQPERVVPIPHFSSGYLAYDEAELPAPAEKFFRAHPAVFFSYICFRKEYTVEFLAEAVRRFHQRFPQIGFLWVGAGERERARLEQFLRQQGLESAVCLLGSVPHELFLTLLTRSLAYIRTPVTDGICSSVMESLSLRVPVLAADNGTRPAGCVRWQAGDHESLLRAMARAVENRADLVASIPDLAAEDNVKKLVENIEEVCCEERTGYQTQSPEQEVKPALTAKSGRET